MDNIFPNRPLCRLIHANAMSKFSIPENLIRLRMPDDVNWLKVISYNGERASIKYSIRQITFLFEKYFKKKLLNIFSNFFFYLKVQSFRLIIENNFMQMAASAGHAVAYMISTIFKYITDCVQLYFTNGFTNIVL